MQKRLIDKDFSSAFVFGNQKANQTLTFVTNPFCKHCKEFYPVFLKLVKKHSDELRINIFFDVDLSREDLDNRTVHLNLTNIYMNSENKVEFLEALSNWYDVQGYSKNKNEWYKKYSKYFGNSENALELSKGHEKWVSSNSVHLWFSKDPVSYGPYKFNGLPGLIMELYDTKKDYYFKVIKSEKITEGYQRISLENSMSRAVPITQKELDKLKLDLYFNPFKYVLNGTLTIPEGKKLLLDDGTILTKEQLKPAEANERKKLKAFNNPIELDKAVKYP